MRPKSSFPTDSNERYTFRSYPRWKLAVRNPDGTCARDQHGHQIFETQAAFKARMAAVPFVPVSPLGKTMDLFA